MASVLLLTALDALGAGATLVAGFSATLAAGFFGAAAAFLAGAAVAFFAAAGVTFFAGALAFGAVALVAVFLAGAAVVFFAVAFGAAALVVLVAFGAGSGAAATPPAFGFHPSRFNLPTTAFLLMPRRLPISAVDNPLPVNAFNFFNVALSQPLLILYQPLLYILWYNSSIVPNRKARGKNMIWQIFFIILLAVALWCAYQISVADLRRRIIPDAYLWPLFLIGLLITNWWPWIIGPRMAATSAVFGYALAAGVGFIFDVIRRRTNPDAETPIGLGDIKLIATGGLWLGVQGLGLALIVACITGGAWARARHQRYIPFAPFFVAGAILSLITMAFLL